MSAPLGIEYRAADWTPLPIFDCRPLRATLTTAACATQWKNAKEGSACAACEVGKTHSKALQPTAKRTAPGARPGTCLRCGRTDQRLIGGCVCVSCRNREYEWRKGRNAKGKPPETYVPLHRRIVAIEDAAGNISFRHLQVRHVAEALGWIARHHLPAGARFSDARPGAPTWSLERQRFEYIDPSSGNLLLERMWASGVLEFTSAGGAPGDGWSVAVPRQPISILTVGEAAVLLDLMADDEIVRAWTPIAHVCGGCWRSPLEGRRHDGGAWEVRCPECGASH